MDVAVDRQRSGKDWLSEIDSWSREVIFLYLPWVARHLGRKPALLPFQQALSHTFRPWTGYHVTTWIFLVFLKRHGKLPELQKPEIQAASRTAGATNNRSSVA